MTNDELKAGVQKMLEDGTATQDTLLLLQDASIHVAMQQGISMEVLDMAYSLLCLGHKFMVALTEIDPSLVKSDDLFGTPKPEPKVDEQERKKINDILGDLEIRGL